MIVFYLLEQPSTMSNIFVAGCVGAFVSQVFFSEVKADRASSELRIAGREVTICLKVALAGYLAAFVFNVQQPVHALLIGLGLESILTTAHRFASRFGERMGFDDGSSVEERNARE